MLLIIFIEQLHAALREWYFASKWMLRLVSTGFLISTCFSRWLILLSTCKCQSCGPTRYRRHRSCLAPAVLGHGRTWCRHDRNLSPNASSSISWLVSRNYNTQHKIRHLPTLNAERRQQRQNIAGPFKEDSTQAGLGVFYSWNQHGKYCLWES